MSSIRERIDKIIKENNNDGVIDSLSTVKIIVKLESEFNIEISDDETIALVGLLEQDFCNKVYTIVENFKNI